MERGKTASLGRWKTAHFVRWEDHSLCSLGRTDQRKAHWGRTTLTYWNSGNSIQKIGVFRASSAVFAGKIIRLTCFPQLVCLFFFIYLPSFCSESQLLGAVGTLFPSVHSLTIKLAGWQDGISSQVMGERSWVIGNTKINQSRIYRRLAACSRYAMIHNSFFLSRNFHVFGSLLKCITATTSRVSSLIW